MEAVTSPDCKLSVVFARDEPVGLILRRGPSKWVQLILWDTRRDRFTDGAWFHGRIYEDRCNLSPDGRLFVYFCHGGHSRPGYSDSWTAVSRPPWLFALGLWPWGTTYGGGGRFTDSRTLVLNIGPGAPLTTHPDHPAKGLNVSADDSITYSPHPSNPEGLEGVDWSGRDQKGGLVYSRSGVLFRAVNDRLPGHEIADFRHRKPEPTSAPEWARKPL